MSDLDDDRGRGEAVPADGAAALQAIAECLRHLACGYDLDPRERAACIELLQAGVPGIDRADLAAAMKILASSGRRTGRQREKASELSLRFSAEAEALRQRPPHDRI